MTLSAFALRSSLMLKLPSIWVSIASMTVA